MSVQARESLEKLLQILRSRPLASFQRIGGDVSFFVKGKGAESEWTFTANASEVRLVEGRAATHAVRIGISEKALGELVAGTLDVAKAFEENRIAIDGDDKALDRFATAFLTADNSLNVRLRR